MRKLVKYGLMLGGGIGMGAFLAGNKLNGIIAEKVSQSEKFRIMYLMMECWFRLKRDGKRLDESYQLRGKKEIAVYGMGDLGKLVVKELSGSEVHILYGIDRSAKDGGSIKMYRPEEHFPDVDAVIVTAIAYFDEIEEMLSEKVNCPIYSLEDIIYDMA